MELPTVKNVLRDPKKRITYEVMAYRELTERELIAAVRTFRATKQGRRVRRNTTYTIITQFGIQDPF